MTGDLVLDAALKDVADCEPADLEGLIERGEKLQTVLQDRLRGLQG